MSQQNRYGLSRYIETDTRRSIRRRCGFGCVFCGCAIIQYHHFAPLFEDAAAHQPEGITLLCGTCHDKAHKDLISPSAVASANALPRCKQEGYAKDHLFFQCRTPWVRLGSTEFHCQYPIVLGNDVVIGFDAPEEPGSPLRLQARIPASDGEPLFEVVDNEWRVGSGLFDVEATANRLQIRDDRRKLIFEMAFRSDAGLAIETLDMSIAGYSIVIAKNGLTVKSPGGGVLRGVSNVFGEAGIYLPAGGGMLLATAAPIPSHHIAEFGPTNELEHALTHSKDSQAGWDRFMGLLLASQVLILEVPCSASPDGQLGLGTMNVEGYPYAALLTSPHRLEPIRRYHPDCSLLAVPFKSFIAGLPKGLGIWMNFGSRVDFWSKVESVGELAQGKPLVWPFGGAGVGMP